MKCEDNNDSDKNNDSDSNSDSDRDKGIQHTGMHISIHIGICAWIKKYI